MALGIAMLVAVANIVNGHDDAARANESAQERASVDGSTLGDATSAEDGMTGGDVESTSELDVPLQFENQPCTGAYVLLFTSSGDPDAYASTIEQGLSYDSTAKYLNAEESCDGFIQTIDGNAVYASYSGVYDSLAAACEARLAIGDVHPVVVRLDSDKTTNRPLCVCLEDAASLPVLSRDLSTDPSTEEELAIVNLQSVLNRGGYATPKVPGAFGKPTENGVRAFQEENELIVDGLVAAQTWRSILANWC